ncbi:response regulator transcription factor [Ethanoligenens harbinense]|uniref:Stage 0 sporulation protein A homolog n=1 Tax=Ethanoligenens harbinense (strain DSM 18485 / JCM 12961 / CGMCC 1.5033 / YUAN-3) TaxID=663278 RepID=E6U333_ETHHY|nr:response regulator transcription factor [Ethanoligenens harbinense]ADU27505.1 two component transcriptional regulator, winged helix family [Ethanoligenens harbinense YUAN-3]AVQ96560.1 DNA-binding response regulator [Ethanoligenens harbinense YUAN-3]AYF39221.1 DNA-binding response regulator [Ethanoligenens harbinense]AYF42045.1 DNA-binding response regulator [Ethanoligenens harbinense]QCN92800.1 DNA-binding response regulator [Ethanoligenens harbinense]
MTKTILVVEDEQAIREFVIINLKRAGYEVLEAGTGEAALKLYESHGNEIRIALLDIMLPGIDGFAVCRELRQKSKTLGIIMLTARTQEMDKVGGLMIGADDYVTKPFSPSELVARVDALYRRLNLEAGEKEDENGIVSGDFVLNTKSRTFYRRGQPIELTQMEYQIMKYFLENPDTALSRGDILNHVWGEDYFGELKIVDVNIRRLRMKVEEDPSAPRHILTVWGFGYKWSKGEPA